MSVLSIDSSNKFELQTQTLVGRSVAVLGITGSGKTNTAAVLIEELLSSGLPLTIVDIEGEYWGLKEKFEILVAGRSEHAELAIGPENAGKLADISVKRGISVILDLSDFTQKEAYDFLVEYFQGLWEASSSTKQPYQIILEEAHEFIPQSTGTPLKQMLTRIALRGRKRGLGIILMSQRSAKVEKDVLTQTSLLFLHKVMHPTDLRVYKDLIPLPSTQVEDMVRKLRPGEAVVVYNHQVNVVQLRLRTTFHAGSTPTLRHTVQPKLRKLDASMLKELRALTKVTEETNRSGNEQEKLAQRVKELEDTVALKDAEIQRLQSQVDLLSKLSVSIEGLSQTSYFPHNQTLRGDRVMAEQAITNSLSDTIINMNDKEPLALTDASKSDQTLTVAEQRKLESLFRRIQKLSKLERSILRLLSEHHGTTMTIATLATWLSLKESTIRSRPPHNLLRMKLITRTRDKNGYKYTSSIYSYLQAEFPKTNSDFLLKQILG